MKLSLFFSSLLFAVSVHGAAPSIGGSLSPVYNSLPVKVFVPAANGADSAPALQALIDSLPRVTDIFSGYGGGKIVIPANSTITLFTNITIPNYFPFNLEIDGGNSVIVLKSTHQNVSKGYFNVATNYVNGLNLTNSLKIEVHHGIWAQEAMLSTNAMFNTYGWGKYHDNIFTTMYGLTNSQGAYTLNWEANVPNQPIGCVAIMHDSSIIANSGMGGSTANAQFDCYNNRFFCLANAIVCGSINTRIHDNYFACIGMYNATPPPADNHTTIHFATNLWQGDVSGSGDPNPMSSGAAILLLTGDPSYVTYNLFYGCGIACYGSQFKFEHNQLSVCGYRLCDDNDFATLTACVISDEPASGGIGGTAPFDDVALTNSTAAPYVWQPDGGTIGQNVRAKTSPNGKKIELMLYNAPSGDTYLSVNGGTAWLTNGVSLLTGGGFWATNSTLPSVNNAIKAWLSVTNDSGKIGKIPVYY